MASIPFKKFIITLLLFNKSIPYIVDKLKSFGYHVDDEDVQSIFTDLKAILPESIRALINEQNPLDPMNESHQQWLKHFGVDELYDYMYHAGTKEDAPPYYKWFDDCIWIHSYRDVMSLVNIFMFNGEPLDQIVDVVRFKYKKQLSTPALERYRELFWNPDNMTAKDAVRLCVPFQDNTVIIRSIRQGSDFNPTIDSASNDGSDIGFAFHDSEYIKWKLGYHSPKVPGTGDFLDQVKRDAYFKYYESMNSTQSAEVEESSGFNDKIGEFNSKLTRYRNVEEQRAKSVQKWLEVFLKADKGKPADNIEKDDFFEKMAQVELEFTEFQEEKIVNIKDHPEVVEDIKSDMT